MQAALCIRHAPVNEVQLVTLPEPLLRPGTVRIAVHYAAVNPPDLLMPEGLYQVRPALPFVMGLEAAGVVTEVATDVTDFQVGDRVMTYAGGGCFAEVVVAPAAQVFPVPEGMSLETAAGFAVVYGTAYHALVDRGQLKRGETVVVLGAGGGIGICAIQIARAIGARVIAVASDEAKLATCREHGADETVLTDTPDLKSRILELTAGIGADVVCDTVGGPLSMRALRGLRPLGRHLIVGYASGEIPQFPGNYLLLKQVSAIGVSFRQQALHRPHEARAGLRALCEMWRAGQLKPVIARVYAFSRFADAVLALRARGAVGKHIIKIANHKANNDA